MNTNPYNLKAFHEKVMWLLEYLYEQGGSEYKPQEFRAELSYGIPGAANPNEFERMMIALRTQGWITFTGLPGGLGRGIRFTDVMLSALGIKEIEKGKRIIPLLSLLSEDIVTGDAETDANIRHARELFLREPQTMENMRSACEALSYALEPMRDNLKLAITVADVEAFFHLVNKFDIRHNKPHTINLLHPEQLEWVFYSLLNTINTYTKMKAKQL